MTDDDVRGALDLLARRADAHTVTDRVPAVRRRARRAAQVRTAVLAAAAVVVVGVAGTLVQGGGRLRGSGPAVTQSVVSPHLDVELAPVTDRTVLTAATRGPYANSGFRVVILVVHVRGAVPEAQDGSTPYGVYYDDGTGGSGGSIASDCAPGAPLVEVDKEEILTLAYPPETTLPSAPVMVTVSACAPVGQVVRRLTVQIPAGGEVTSDITPVPPG